ncbi:hypothetical protein LJC32_06390 [Oscillospiraceae bacterium OttesenSCG-928-F05]|nr:hypothetical protein [Oscillospiraceae bacterium OttesenSCG-928-F05]
MPESARDHILDTIAKNTYIKKLIIESRPQYITDDTLDVLEKALKGKTVEIGFGVESENDLVRNTILNKDISKADFIALKNRTKRTTIKLLAYVLIKPPFLSEAEAILEAITTINYANSLNVDVISIEPVSVQENTLVWLLSENGLYTPPWIWSIIQIVSTVYNVGTEIRIGGFEYYPLPKQYVSNCEYCNSDFVEAIQAFNASYNLDKLLETACVNQCHKEWQKSLGVIEKEAIVDRAIRILESIDVEKTIEVRSKLHC